MSSDQLTIEETIKGQPSQYFELWLRCHIRKYMPKEAMAEYERLIASLFSYFNLPYGDKLREAESKVESLKYTIELRNNEIKNLQAKIDAQSKLLKADGLRESMFDLSEKLQQLSYDTKP